MAMRAAVARSGDRAVRQCELAVARSGGRGGSRAYLGSVSIGNGALQIDDVDRLVVVLVQGLVAVGADKLLGQAHLRTDHVGHELLQLGVYADRRLGLGLAGLVDDGCERGRALAKLAKAKS